MNKEMIEKAANVYIGHEPEIDEGIEVSMIRSAFKDGANWRINSVWHTASEVPENKPALVEYPHWDGSYGYLIVLEPEDLAGSITKWAYLEDLLPAGKEVQP